MLIRSFKKSYGNRLVLNISETELKSGRVYAVIGSNGSGKSTLARLLADIERPDDGRRVLEKISTAYMPQKSYPFRMSVKRNILLGGRDEKRCGELMRELGLCSLADANASRLSGGETAKTALARIMMRSSELLILDEPTAAMDMASSLSAEGLISRYCRETNCVLLLITHSIHQAKRIADDIIFMHKGEIIEQAPKELLLSSPKSPLTGEFLKYYGL